MLCNTDMVPVMARKSKDKRGIIDVLSTKYNYTENT